MNEKIEKAKSKVKKFWNENKELIVIGTTALGAIIVSGVIMTKTANEVSDQEETKNLELEPVEEFDYGRDCLMTFTVEETGEELGKVRCCESFVDDWRRDGLLESIIESDYGVAQDGLE